MPPPTAPGPTTGSPPSTGETPRTTGRRGVDTGGWRDWWDANCAALVSRRGPRTRVTTDSPLFRVGGDEAGNRTDAERPTERAIEDSILPTLRWVIDPKNRLDADAVAAAYLAIGKTARGEADVRVLLDACRRRGSTPLVHESAVLSLGLLRRSPRASRFDGRLLDEVRAALFATLDDDGLPTRTRSFAALAVGLLGDQENGGATPFARSGAAVVRGLWMRLEEKHAGEDLPVALCLALSLEPPAAVPTGVLDGLRSLAVAGRLAGRNFGPLARAQALLALARLSDSTGAGVFLGTMRGRSVEAPIRRAAIVSLGIAAPRLAADARRDAAVALCDEYARGDDPDSLGMMVISLARLLAAEGREGGATLLDGTQADETLLRAVRVGRAEVKPFAALALGIAGRGVDTASDSGSLLSFRDRSIGALREGAADERMNPTSRGAYCLGLGLLEDEGAIKPLNAIAGRRGVPDALRGYACTALGLVGHPTPEVIQTLKAALKERSSEELRRQAAAGLGHLGDVSAVPLLLGDLESGGSDHVLAQDVLGLGAIGDAAAVPALARIVRDTRATFLLRAIACAGLGLVGDMEPFPSLSRLGADSNYLTPIDALYEALTLL